MTSKSVDYYDIENEHWNPNEKDQIILYSWFDDQPKICTDDVQNITQSHY